MHAEYEAAHARVLHEVHQELAVNASHIMCAMGRLEFSKGRGLIRLPRLLVHLLDIRAELAFHMCDGLGVAEHEREHEARPRCSHWYRPREFSFF